MHYFQHFIGDYRADTSHLSLLEHGVYRQLLDQYYLSELPITLDENKLFRTLSARTEDEIKAIKNVLEDFFIKTENGYIHKRCDIEIEAYQAKSQTASQSAKKRWSKERNPNEINKEAKRDIENVMQRHTERIPNAMLTNNNKLITNNNKQVINDFNEFWQLYPKKVGKGSSEKSWDKLKPDIELIIKALLWQCKSPQWTINDGQYIPNPTTYLNQHRWLDEPPERISF